MERFEVVVIGGGPSGRATAAACARRGLRTVCLDPTPDRGWPNNYGAWRSEVEALGLADCVARAWPRAEVITHKTTVIERGYVQIDNAALRARLSQNVLVRAARVDRIEGSTLHFDDGARIAAELVVDATGHLGRFTQRPSRPAFGFQAAWGLDVEVDGHPFPLDTMRLMDFSAVPGAPSRPPAFLYVMPASPTRIFVEETVLVGRPATPFETLEARLHARLEHLGIQVREVHAVERCLIPMGGPLPDLRQPIVAIGAAAGMVHPATGFMLMGALRGAEALAEALADELSAQAGWAAIWPRERQRLWALYRFGMEVLLHLDQAATRTFFEAFFTVPAEAQSGWLAGTLRVAEATAVMRTVFSALPGGLRARLIAHGVRPHGWRMLRALLG